MGEILLLPIVSGLGNNTLAEEGKTKGLYCGVGNRSGVIANMWDDYLCGYSEHTMYVTMYRSGDWVVQLASDIRNTNESTLIYLQYTYGTDVLDHTYTYTTSTSSNGLYYAEQHFTIAQREKSALEDKLYSSKTEALEALRAFILGSVTVSIPVRWKGLEDTFDIRVHPQS